MASDTVLTGSLEFLPLGDLLQLVGSNGSTGILRLSSKYTQEPGEVYIQEGNPIHAVNGSLSGIDAINSLFGWTIGRFEFEEKPTDCERTIKKSRMNIILDSLSMLDEGTIETLGPVSYDRKPSDAPSKDPVVPVIRGPMIDYMYVVDEEAFREGQEIAEEGSHGNWIWVVLEGIVQIAKQTDKGPVTLLNVTEGAFVGSSASFQIGGNVRGASAVAIGDVQLGVLDSQRLAGEYAQMSSAFRGLVTGMDRRLRELTDHTIQMRRGENTAPEMIRDKKRVIKQGDAQEKIFALSQGDACVVGRVNKEYIPLAKLSPGDIFGRLPFLDIGHEPDAAAVFGAEGLKVKSIDPDDLKKEYEGLSTTFKNMLEHMANCIAVTTRLLYDVHKKVKPAKPGKN